MMVFAPNVGLLVQRTTVFAPDFKSLGASEDGPCTRLQVTWCIG